MKKPLIITAIIVSTLAMAATFAPGSVHAEPAKPEANTRAASPNTLSANNTYQRTVTVGARKGVAEHRFDLQLPAGASLQPLPSERGEAELVSEILVVDQGGKTIGVIDSAWAQDTKGKALFTFFRIEGNTLVQSIDASDASKGRVTAVLMYAGSAVDPDAGFIDSGAAAGEITTSAVTFVTVPSNYVYKPSLGSLHDYCTASPDEFPNPFGANANFRGPCARHDLCYAGTTSAFTCDVNLRENMRINCRHAYAWYNPTRAVCYDTANIYFAAVVLHTGS